MNFDSNFFKLLFSYISGWSIGGRKEQFGASVGGFVRASIENGLSDVRFGFERAFGKF